MDSEIQMIPHDRGRGRHSSHRGRGGRGRGISQGKEVVIATMGNKRLIAANIGSSSYNGSSSKEISDNIQIDTNNPLYAKIMELIEIQKAEEVQKTPSYANIAYDNDDENWVISQRQKKIILLNQEDIKYFDEPWMLMQKYLEPATYEAMSSKARGYFENILQVTDTAEIRHLIQEIEETCIISLKFILNRLYPPKNGDLVP